MFPDGAYAAGAIEMVRDFDRSTADRLVQQTDKETGLPLWVVEVIDAQENARQRTVKVKIAAPVSRCCRPPAPGSPFTASSSTALPPPPTWIPPAARATASTSAPPAWPTAFKAAGVRAPARGIGRPAPEHKDAA